MRSISLVVLATLLAAGCIRTTRNKETGKVDVDVESPTKQGEDWDAKINGMGMGASISGESHALVADGRTRITVSLVGAPAGSRLPWHVHDGDCGSGGAIVGDPSAYAPLLVGSDGRASGNANINPQLNEAKDYHINVHASSSDMGTIIACGNLDD